MKVLTINGSAHRNGNIAIMINKVFEVESDGEGMKNMKSLGRNMAHLIKTLNKRSG